VFVAKFIGSPGMNLVPATLVEQGGELRADLGAAGTSAPLSPELAAAARNTGAREIWYGFRPEERSVAAGEAGRAAAVTFVERIGSRTIVHFEIAGEPARGVFENDVALPEGSAARIDPGPGAVRLFDRQSGNAIGGTAHGRH